MEIGRYRCGLRTNDSGGDSVNRQEKTKTGSQNAETQNEEGRKEAAEVTTPFLHSSFCVLRSDFMF
jgi:hypothetical protein